MKTLKPDSLKRVIADLFARAGCGDEEAVVIADHLVEANLVGHDSHGVIRAPIYLQWMNDGKVFAGKSLQIVVDAGSLVVADACLGYGQWTGRQAVAIGVNKCREHGVAIVALKNAAHIRQKIFLQEIYINLDFTCMNFLKSIILHKTKLKMQLH